MRAILEAMSRSNQAATPHPIPPSNAMMPGAVVLVSNLNEKVCCCACNLFSVFTSNSLLLYLFFFEFYR